MTLADPPSDLPAATLLNTAVVVLVALLFYNIRSYISLRHVPGPFFHSLSSFGLLKTHLDGSPHLEILKWTQKYGMYLLDLNLS